MACERTGQHRCSSVCPAPLRWLERVVTRWATVAARSAWGPSSVRARRSARPSPQSGGAQDGQPGDAVGGMQQRAGQRYKIEDLRAFAQGFHVDSAETNRTAAAIPVELLKDGRQMAPISGQHCDSWEPGFCSLRPCRPPFEKILQHVAEGTGVGCGRGRDRLGCGVFRIGGRAAFFFSVPMGWPDLRQCDGSQRRQRTGPLLIPSRPQAAPAGAGWSRRSC